MGYLAIDLLHYNILFLRWLIVKMTHITHMAFNQKLFRKNRRYWSPVVMDNNCIAVRTRSIKPWAYSNMPKDGSSACKSHDIEKRLWDAADQLRANSKTQGIRVSLPVLDWSSSSNADHVFARAAKDLEGKSTGRRTIGKIDYQDKGVLFLPEKARFSYWLVSLRA